MRVLKAIEKGKLSIIVTLEFDKPFNTSEFSFGLLSLERKNRSLYLDVVDSFTFKTSITLAFEYDEDILASDVSKRADLKVEDLILGLDEAKLYIGEDTYVTPDSIVLAIEGENQTELKINLTIE